MRRFQGIGRYLAVAIGLAVLSVAWSQPVSAQLRTVALELFTATW